MSDIALDGQLALVAVVIGWEARNLAEHGESAHSLPVEQRPIAAAVIIVSFLVGFIATRAATKNESLGVVGGVVASNAALYAAEGWLRRSGIGLTPPSTTPASASISPAAPAQSPSTPPIIAAPPRTAIPGAN